MRKLALLSCLLVFITSSIQAQEWLTDFAEAQKVAKEKDRKIILVFQGSDWSGMSKRFNKEMWTNQEFIDYANDHFVLLNADFPKREENRLSHAQRDHNKKLADKYNRGKSLPFIVVLDKDGEVLGTTGYKKISPYRFIELLEFFEKE